MKKRRVIKIVSTLLILSLSITMLAGCKNKKDAEIDDKYNKGEQETFIEEHGDVGNNIEETKVLDEELLNGSDEEVLQKLVENAFSDNFTVDLSAVFKVESDEMTEEELADAFGFKIDMTVKVDGDVQHSTGNMYMNLFGAMDIPIDEYTDVTNGIKYSYQTDVWGTEEKGWELQYTTEGSGFEESINLTSDDYTDIQIEETKDTVIVTVMAPAETASSAFDNVTGGLGSSAESVDLVPVVMEFDKETGYLTKMLIETTVESEEEDVSYKAMTMIEYIVYDHNTTEVEIPEEVIKEANENSNVEN